MSYGIEPFAVSLAAIEEALGGRARAPGFWSRLFGRSSDLVDEIKRQHGYLFQNDELAEDDEFVVEETLRSMLAGSAHDENRSEYYAWALKALCWHFGEFLDNSEWCAMRSEWSDRVDHAIAQAGLAEEVFGVQRHLIYRGAPIGIPEPADFPFVGYLRLTEIPQAASALAACDLSSGDEDVRRAVTQVHGWLARSLQLNRDLVCFYH